MYLLLSLLIILLFTPFIIEGVRSLIYVLHVRQHALKVKPRIVTCGRLLKAYSIESIHFLTSHKSFMNGTTGIFVYKFLRYFGMHDRYIKIHSQYLQVLVQADLYEKSNQADYIVNYHEHASIDDDGGVFLFASCDCIKMYPETIPLLNFPEGEVKATPLSLAPSIMQIGGSFVIAILMMFTMQYAVYLYSTSLVKSFSSHQEELLWSYVERSVLGKQELSTEATRIQNVLNHHLENIKAKAQGLRYDYRIYVLDTDIEDVDLYPSGKIVITRGMALRLKKEGQLNFLLLHMIAHFELNDHIKFIKRHLATYSVLTDLFSKGSYIASFFVNPQDFEVEYSQNKEIAADKWAIDKQHELFGKVGGFEVFAQDFYDMSQAYNSLYNSHPFSLERTENVRQFLSEKNYTILDDKDLNYGIVKEQAKQQDTFVFDTDVNVDYFALFAEYKKEQGEIYKQYQALLNNLKTILVFKKVPSRDEIAKRKEYVHQAIHQVDDFAVKFNKHLDASDAKMNEYFESKKMDKLRVKLNEQMRLWQSEIEDMRTLAGFYFERDKKILVEQHLMLNYIGLRHETIKVGAYGIEFASQKEQNDFNVMQKRLENLIKTPPPSRKQRT